MNEKSEGRLARAASPYLRSAVHQSVDWYEWGEEAFARARAEDKPILLDIGAVWCHWCHVIDRESYENPQLAAIINQLFIPVKVDRDERPDVDARYQAAISTLSGQGGWPLTGFLLPDGRPFFGGTYFPPEDAMGRPGFRRILEAVAAGFHNRRAEVEEAASRLAEAVAHAETFAGGRGVFDSRVAVDQAESILNLFDSRNGGFGRAPKFPHPAAIDLLLECHQAGSGLRTLEVAAFTLEKMGSGGVYDQVAGGFHRYSVDERWCVPHFEKMSYDNSELLKNFLHGYQVAREPFFREIAEGIIDWTNAVLSDQSRGGFYASQDADQTLDDDGDYFTWTLDEVRAVLTPEESRVVELRYDVEPHGEMHHNPAKNVLWIARSIAEVTRTIGGRHGHGRGPADRWRAQRENCWRRARRGPLRLWTRLSTWRGTRCMSRRTSMPRRCLAERRAPRAARSRSRRSIACSAKPGATRADSRIAWAARASTDRSTIKFLRGSRCWTPMRRRSIRNISTQPVARRILPSPNILMQKAEAFTIALRARRRWAGSKCAASRCRILRHPAQIPRRPFCSTVCTATPETRVTVRRAEATLEAFAAIAPQFGIHAASYGLAALLHARGPFEVVITGRSDDPQAAALESGSKFRLPVRQSRSSSHARAHGIARCSCARASRNTSASSRRRRASAGLCRHDVPPARHRSRRARRAADAKACRAFR